MRKAAAYLLVIIGLLAIMTAPIIPERGRTPVHDVVIPEGASAAEIGRILENEGIIPSALHFRLAARMAGEDGDIRAGSYRLGGEVWPGEAIEALRRGPEPEGDIEVTIPEGKTIEETARILADAGVVGEDEFTAAAMGMEGFLFPDTYRFYPASPPEEVIRRMRARFEEETADLLPAARANGLDLDGLVTLASIIEKESAVPDERPLISGVFHNRLRRRMPLGADPTVRYALGNPDRPLTYADLEVDSPYNTYRYPGLPPGPIASPGRASLQAAANPASTDYLYFVARGDGSGGHRFSRTLAEHERNRALMRRERRG